MKIGHDNIRTLTQFICWVRRAEWLETSVMLLGRNHITHTCTSTPMSQWCGGAPGARSEHSTHKTPRCSTPRLHTHCFERKRTEWAHVDPYEQRLCWYYTTCKTTLLAQNTTHAGTLPVPALANVGQRHHLKKCLCMFTCRSCWLCGVYLVPSVFPSSSVAVHPIFRVTVFGSECEVFVAVYGQCTRNTSYIYIYIYMNTHTSVADCRSAAVLAQCWRTEPDRWIRNTYVLPHLEHPSSCPLLPGKTRQWSVNTFYWTLTRSLVCQGPWLDG